MKIYYTTCLICTYKIILKSMFDTKKPYNELPFLPWNFDFEQKEILKLTIKASESISKLNWLIYLVPNLEILISPLLTKESVESSAIENINTTTIKVLQQQALWEKYIKWPEKEVLHYHNAILNWFKDLKKQWGIWYNFLLNLQSIIEPNKVWIRKIPWTVIANSLGEVLYTPPEWEQNIIKLLTNLERFINNFWDDIDPLIKMPVIHYQFESIHPFYDWNGRTWRIINILYLVKNDLLNMPILYLSNYIIKHKSDYYRLLQEVREKWNRDEWILYILDAIEKTSIDTMEMIKDIWDLMWKTKKSMKEKVPKLYSKDLLEIIFSHPYTKIDFLVDNMWMTRQRASRYLQELVDNWYMNSIQIKNSKFFINIELFERLKKWL